MKNECGHQPVLFCSEKTANDCEAKGSAPCRRCGVEVRWDNQSKKYIKVD